MGDGEQPRTKVLPVAKARIGTQRSHEGLLEAVLRRVRADAPDEEPMEPHGVVIDQALERREAHCP